MASPPFTLATTTPQTGDAQSAYPAAEDAFRDSIASALGREHDVLVGGSSFGAHHKFGTGTTAARDAITDWVVGSIWFNTDFNPAVLQRVNSIGPVVWISVGAGANTIQTLTPGVSVSWNMALGDNMFLTPAQSFTLTNPTNPTTQRRGVMIFTQDGVGSRIITWGSAYKFPLGVKFILSTAANATDVVDFTVNGANVFCLSIGKAFA